MDSKTVDDIIASIERKNRFKVDVRSCGCLSGLRWEVIAEGQTRTYTSRGATILETLHDLCCVIGECHG